jgi:hypothetical protein
MFASLRKTLIDSHVAAVTVAALLLASCAAFYLAADRVVCHALFFVQLIADHHLSTALWKLESEDPDTLAVALTCLFDGVAVVLAAWIVSHWVYGVGPLRCLGSYREKLTRKFHA